MLAFNLSKIYGYFVFYPISIIILFYFILNFQNSAKRTANRETSDSFFENVRQKSGADGVFRNEFFQH